MWSLPLFRIKIASEMRKHGHFAYGMCLLSVANCNTQRQHTQKLCLAAVLLSASIPYIHPVKPSSPSCQVNLEPDASEEAWLSSRQASLMMHNGHGVVSCMQGKDVLLLLMSTQQLPRGAQAHYCSAATATTHWAKFHCPSSAKHRQQK